MSKVSYTPMSVKIPYNSSVRVGDIIRVTDSNGVTITSYITGLTTNGKSMTLTSVGNESRTGTSYVNSKRYEDLEGRVLNIKASVDGLIVEARDLKDNYSTLEQTSKGLVGTVGEVSDRLDATTNRVSTLEKTVKLSVTANDVTIAIENKLSGGVNSVSNTIGKFDSEGLKINKSDKDMESLLDESGLSVTKSGQTVLTANNEGVEAVNLKAQEYLISGKHARFQDYGYNRTGCFYI